MDSTSLDKILLKAIIFQFGIETTKVGYPGDMNPLIEIPSKIFVLSNSQSATIRDEYIFNDISKYSNKNFAKNMQINHIIPTNIDNQMENNELADINFKIVLRKFLRQIIYDYISSSFLKDFKVFVIEDFLHNTWVHNALESTLLNDFNASYVYFLSKPQVTIIPFNLDTSLVIDFNYNEISIIPIVQNFILTDCVKYLPLGMKVLIDSTCSYVLEALFQRLVTMLKDCSELDYLKKVISYIIETLKQTQENSITPYFINVCSFKIRGTPTTEREIFSKLLDIYKSNYTEKTESQIASIFLNSKVLHNFMSQSLADYLFTEEIYEETLQHAIISTIKKCPIDYRKTLSSNIVFSGELPQIKYFRKRVLEQIRITYSTDIMAYAIHESSFMPSNLAYIGASVKIKAVIEAMKTTKNKYNLWTNMNSSLWPVF